MFTNDGIDINKRIQSVEVGFSILRAMADQKKSMTLTELSAATGLHKSQLYRYLNSFVYMGVLNRYDDEIPKWSLGPELIALGGAAFDEIDIAKQASAKMIELRNRINETVALSIWRQRGPFFLRWEKSNKTVNVGVDTGSYVPLFSATGKVFRAFLPKEVTDPFYRELVEQGAIVPETFNEEVEIVHRTHLSVTESSLNLATAALSTPIFDSSGKLAGALSIIGLRGVLNTAPDGPAALALVDAAADVSYRMGFLTGTLLSRG